MIYWEQKAVGFAAAGDKPPPYSARARLSPRLRFATDARWFEAARRDLGALLSDHLHCERKAAETALSLVRRYAGEPAFVEPLMRLAHEETSHLVQVSVALAERDLRLRADTPNHYTRGLLAEVRPQEPGRRIDLLLVSALIEARSHERLALLGRGFAGAGDERLAALYEALASAEDRHAQLYVELAAAAAPLAAVEARLDELTAREAEIIASLPFASRVH